MENKQNKKIKSFAVSTISKMEDVHPMDAKNYSRMKYGDPIATRRSAIQITSHLFRQPEITKYIHADKTIFITSSAYGYVPTASYSVTREVTKLLAASGVKIDRIKFVRNGDFSTNHYGTLSAEERAKKMTSRNIHLTEEDLVKIKDGFVLVIDDIAITGSHERKIHEILSQTEARDWAFIYLYKLDTELGNKIPETEEHLNRADIKTVLDLIPFFRIYTEYDLKLRLNSRVLKFILTTEPESFYDVSHDVAVKHLKEFFALIDDKILADVYRAAMSPDGYHADPKFAEGLHILREEILERRGLSRLFNKIMASIEENLNKETETPVLA